MSVAPRIIDRVSPKVVGRADVLELADRRWAAAAAGHGHMLLVAGEPGIGKTRLMHEVSQRHDGRSPRALSFPREVDAPGALLLNLGDELARLGDDGTASALQDILLTRRGDGDDARRYRVLIGELATTLLDSLARPTLWRLEDLHWADELSLDVLERVASAITETPSMIIGTYRTVNVPATWLHDWRSRLLAQRLAEEITLRRLDLEDTARMLEAILGEPPSTAFAEELHRRSDGIPLHIEELLGGGAELPASIADAITARLEALGPDERAVVQAASVIGRTFDPALLSRITRSDGPLIDHALHELEQQQLVVPSQDVFGFRHSLICDVVYATIEPDRRRELHAEVARSADLGDAFTSEHYERAGAMEQAHRHAVAAAQEAVRVSAHRAAAGLYERALRTAPPTLGGSEIATLHGWLGLELAAIDEVERAAEELRVAIGLHRAGGDEVAAARLVPALMAMRHLLADDLDTRSALAFDALSRLGDGAPDDVRAGVIAALSAAAMLSRRLGEAEAYGREAAELAHAAGDTALATDVDITLGVVLTFSGAPEGWESFERGIAAAQSAGLDSVSARGHRMISSSAALLVEYDRAETWCERGLQETADTQHWNDHHYIAAHAALVAWATGDLERAESIARRARADGQGVTTTITAQTVLGFAHLSRGAFPAARAELTEVLGIAERMRELQRISPALWGLAECALAEGDPESARELADRALRMSEEVQDAAYLFPFVLTGTRARLELGDRGGARGWIARCSALLRSRGIPGTLPAIGHATALLELAEGRRARGTELLQSALREWRAWRRAWEAGLAVLALASVDAPDTGPLTAREFEVAQLMAGGSTNRQIAETLVIAPKTVARHVEHILAKLGMARRAEVAAWFASRRR